MRSVIVKAVVIAAVGALTLGGTAEAKRHHHHPRQAAALTLGVAQQTASRLAWQLPVPAGSAVRSWSSVKVPWCMQGGKYQFACYMEADGSAQQYDPTFDFTMTVDAWCQRTADVLKNSHSGRISTRLEPNLSCFSG